VNQRRRHGSGRSNVVAATVVHVAKRERDNVQSKRRLAGAAWSEARRDGGNIMLVEQEEGLTWWWRVARRVAKGEGGAKCSARDRGRTPPN